MELDTTHDESHTNQWPNLEKFYYKLEIKAVSLMYS